MLVFVRSPLFKERQFMDTNVKSSDRFNSGIAKCICDETSRVIYANQDFYHFTGYEEEEFRVILKNELLSLVPNDDAVLFWQNTALQQEGAAVFRLFTKNGDLRTTLAKSEKTLRSDQKEYISFSFYNISEADELHRQENEASVRMQAILENMVSGVALLELCDKETVNILYLSPGFYAMCDLEKGLELPQLSQFLHPQEQTKLITALQQAHDSKSMADHIFATRNLRGEIQYRHLRAVEINFHNSNFPVFLAAAMDVSTIKKQQLQALREQTKLQGLLDGLPAGLAIWQLQPGALVTDFASQGLYRLTGIGMEDFNTCYLQDFLPLIAFEDQQPLLQELQHAKAQQRQASFYFRFFRKYGNTRQLRWALLRGFLLGANGQNPVFLVLLQDVTQQKNLETELTANQHRLHLALSQTEALIFEVDHLRQSCAVWQAAHHTGPADYTFAQIPGDILRTNRIAPEDVDEFRRFCTRLLQGDASGQTILTLLGTEGARHCCQISFRNTFGKNGRPILALGLCREIAAHTHSLVRLHSEQLLLQGIAHQTLSAAEGDIDDNRLLYRYRKAADQKRYSTVETYDDLVETGIAFAENEQTKIQLRQTMNCQALRQTWEQGNNHVYMEYRRFDEQGNLRWVSCESYLTEEPFSGHLRSYNYLRDIGQRKALEMLLFQPIQPLHVTGLYAKESLLQLIEADCCRAHSPAQAAGLLLLEIQEATPPNGDCTQSVFQQLCRLAKLLRLLFDGPAVVAEEGENRILLFFPQIAERQQLPGLLQELVQILNHPAAAPQAQSKIHYAIGGTALEYGQNPSAQKLYDQALQGLTKARKAASSTIRWAICSPCLEDSPSATAQKERPAIAGIANTGNEASLSPSK